MKKYDLKNLGKVTNKLKKRKKNWSLSWSV